MENSLTLANGRLAASAHYTAKKVAGMENFLKQVNQPPPAEELKDTPDRRAKTLPISFVQTKLDEIYVGQWGTSELSMMQVGNEIVGNLLLWVIHPVSGIRIERAGTAAVQITVDAVPDDVKGDPRAKNTWALDMQNKKPNAMYLAAPKLKSECIKNAAATLGPAFGRDINRKQETVDTYESIYSDRMEIESIKEELQEKLDKCSKAEGMKDIWDIYAQYHGNPQLRRFFTAYKAQRKFQ